MAEKLTNGVDNNTAGVLHTSVSPMCTCNICYVHFGVLLIQLLRTVGRRTIFQMLS